MSERLINRLIEVLFLEMKIHPWFWHVGGRVKRGMLLLMLIVLMLLRIFLVILWLLVGMMLIGIGSRLGWSSSISASFFRSHPFSNGSYKWHNHVQTRAEIIQDQYFPEDQQIFINFQLKNISWSQPTQKFLGHNAVHSTVHLQRGKIKKLVSPKKWFVKITL